MGTVKQTCIGFNSNCNCSDLSRRAHDPYCSAKVRPESKAN